MKEEKPKKSKGLIVVIVILIILVLGLIAYIVYDKVLTKEEPKQEETTPIVENTEPNFYDVSELLKNGYIKKIESTETEHIKITDGKVQVKSIYSEDFEDAQGIEAAPKYVYSMGLCSDCQGLGYIVLTENNDVYYAMDDFENQTVTDFKKANTEKITNIYNTYLYQEHYFYAEIDNTTLLRVDENGINSANTFENDWPYVDYLYRPNTGRSIALKMDKDKKIYNNDNEELKYNNESLTVEEAFAKIDYTTEEPTTTYYIISNNNIYTTMESTNVNLYNSKQVKDYTITKNDYSGLYNVTITYTDNTTETLSEVSVSTIYQRTNNN